MKISIGAGHVDVLVTTIATLFDIEYLWTFRCANEEVREKFYHLYAHNTVRRNYAVGIVRARRSVDRMLGGAAFPEHVQTSLLPTQPSVQWLMGLFPGGKAAGALC